MEIRIRGSFAKTAAAQAGGCQDLVLPPPEQEGGINQKYLMVLAKPQMLFQQALREIHHWQLKSYYATILTVAASDLPDIKPWQPLSYYKVFLQKYSKKRRGQKSSFFSAGDGDDGGQAK